MRRHTLEDRSELISCIENGNYAKAARIAAGKLGYPSFLVGILEYKMGRQGLPESGLGGLGLSQAPAFEKKCELKLIYQRFAVQGFRHIVGYTV